MLKWFYMAPFLSPACPSLFSCTCPIWEGLCLAITACGSLVLLYLVKVTLPQRVWDSGERRESKCLCSVPGRGSVSGCGAGQTTTPASAPHLSPWWDIPDGHLRKTQGKQSILVPPAACFALLSPEATQNQGSQRSLLSPWTAAVPPHGLGPVSVLMKYFEISEQKRIRSVYHWSLPTLARCLYPKQETVEERPKKMNKLPQCTSHREVSPIRQDTAYHAPSA